MGYEQQVQHQEAVGTKAPTHLEGMLDAPYKVHPFETRSAEPYTNGAPENNLPPCGIGSTIGPAPKTPANPNPYDLFFRAAIREIGHCESREAVSPGPRKMVSATPKEKHMCRYQDKKYTWGVD